jgi:hypothetical protein
MTNILIALLTTIAIAGALTLAMFAAGAFAERNEARAVRAAIPNQPADDRELVLR